MTTQTEQSSAELDRVRIAEAMGIEVTGTKHSVPFGWRDGKIVHVPGYFHSADAALEICEFMRSKGWSVTAGRCDDHPWVMNFWMITGEGDSTEMFEYEGNGDTLSEAICAAFLAWMDAQNDVQKGESNAH